MIDARFLQIHSLHGFAAVLLNRDDAGVAKRLLYGNAIRTRVSSQCLKRALRMADGEHALSGIDGATAAVRSREIVTRRVMEPLAAADHDPDALAAIEAVFQRAVYGEQGAKRSKRQPMLLGSPRSPIWPRKPESWRLPTARTPRLRRRRHAPGQSARPRT